MSTSQFGYRVRFPSTRLAEREPVSSKALKLLANNAHHYADQKCNHLVNWVAPQTSLTTSANYLQSTGSESVWSLLTIHGPFPITIHGNGTRAYRMRLRLAGATSGLATASFAAVLAPGGGKPPVGPDSITPGFGATFATASTTPAWLAAVDGALFFEPHPSLITPALQPISTFTDTGGTPASVDTYQLNLHIFTKTSSDDVATRLWAVHLSEYVGL